MRLGPLLEKSHPVDRNTKIARTSTRTERKLTEETKKEVVKARRTVAGIHWKTSAVVRRVAGAEERILKMKLVEVTGSVTETAMVTLGGSGGGTMTKWIPS